VEAAKGSKERGRTGDGDRGTVSAEDVEFQPTKGVPEALLRPARDRQDPQRLPESCRSGASSSHASPARPVRFLLAPITDAFDVFPFFRFLVSAVAVTCVQLVLEEETTHTMLLVQVQRQYIFSHALPCLNQLAISLD
jgi:hypothetical protein